MSWAQTLRARLGNHLKSVLLNLLWRIKCLPPHWRLTSEGQLHLFGGDLAWLTFRERCLFQVYLEWPWPSSCGDRGIWPRASNFVPSHSPGAPIFRAPVSLLQLQEKVGTKYIIYPHPFSLPPLLLGQSSKLQSWPGFGGWLCRPNSSRFVGFLQTSGHFYFSMGVKNFSHFGKDIWGDMPQHHFLWHVAIIYKGLHGHLLPSPIHFS